MKKSIYPTLEKLGLTSKQSRFLYNDKTRDVDQLKVWKDKISGIIYIEDFYTGDETYIDGSYLEDKNVKLTGGPTELEFANDAQRRVKSNLKFVAGKNIADFGCGNGDFLKLVKPYCANVSGIEIQQNYVDELNNQGIFCVNNLDTIKNDTLDVLLSFHVIEHLYNPLEILSKFMNKIVVGGHVIIEVPHANDFLLSVLECEKFKQYKLWSQHLILHTRESLTKTLEFVGLKDIQIEGVQRYPISNHLNWLANGKGGGHKSPLSMIDSDILFDAYQNSLARINATDTLVAVAKKY
tara:strand:- start:180 stop:1064 length:885 start_codon:yes stop_codon:yes gene_type:complete